MFVVDRPFIFYIYDHVNNVPLFVGRINNPDAKTRSVPPNFLYSGFNSMVQVKIVLKLEQWMQNTDPKHFNF